MSESKEVRTFGISLWVAKAIRVAQPLIRLIADAIAILCGERLHRYITLEVWVRRRGLTGREGMSGSAESRGVSEPGLFVERRWWGMQDGKGGC